VPLALDPQNSNAILALVTIKKSALVNVLIIAPLIHFLITLLKYVCLVILNVSLVLGIFPIAFLVPPQHTSIKDFVSQIVLLDILPMPPPILVNNVMYLNAM
jgi:hypothetical protein